jgi:hypothetical protein
MIHIRNQLKNKILHIQSLEQNNPQEAAPFDKKQEAEKQIPPNTPTQTLDTM